jgi:hypothetical protein
MSPGFSGLKLLMESVNARAVFGVTERRACRVIGQPRSTQRRRLRPRSDEKRLTADIVRLASIYGRYGYRRITALLRQEGWRVNAKRVDRIWRREGLKVPHRQPKRGRLWLNDGSCIRLRPTHRGHVWSYDFVADRTHEGKAFRMLTVIDEFSRECLAIHVQRQLRVIAHELVESMRGSATVDWQHKASARARMRVLVKRILRKFGYPPDLEQEAVQTVLAQAEVMLREVCER